MKEGFDKIQHLFTIKALKKVWLEGTYLNIIHIIYDRTIVNILLNGENQKAFPPICGMRQNCSLSPLLFNVVVEILTREIRQGKEIKVIQIQKEEVKLSICRKYCPILKRC
jgi:hypothetical protein